MTTAMKPADEIVLTIAKQEDQYRRALPSDISAERFVRIAQTAIRKEPKLLECSNMSIQAALLKCAADGLVPDGREAAIIPFGKDAVYMPMTYGLCKKVYNSGQIKMIDALVVCEGDEYDSWVDEHGPHFKHRVSRKARGPIVLTYGYAITKDGNLFFEEITEEQMKAIESVSKQKTGPWTGPFRDEMRRKSAIRRLYKRLPSSSENLNDFRDDDDDVIEAEVKEPHHPEPVRQSSSRLADVIEAKEQAVSAESTPDTEMPL